MQLNLSLKYSLLSLIAFFVFLGMVKGQGQQKKNIEKSYKVSPLTKLRIENKFGRIEVNSWQKAEFNVHVEIISKAQNEEQAQHILDAIKIAIYESSTEIVFETEIDEFKNKIRRSFEVNYTIYMPNINPLDIKNRFGDVIMGNRDGNLSLNVAYGSMKVGDVKGLSDIRLSFGNGSMGNIQRGDFSVKYSDLEIESATQIEMKQGFSDIELKKVDDLEMESKYGKVEVEKAGKIDMEAHFSDFSIEELTESLKLDCSYLKDFSIERLAKSFTLVDIEGKFGSYEIGLESGMNADINAEFRFADLKVDADVGATFNYRIKESNKRAYKGKIGKGDPNKMIRIVSAYGDLRLDID